MQTTTIKQATFEYEHEILVGYNPSLTVLLSELYQRGINYIVTHQEHDQDCWSHIVLIDKSVKLNKLQSIKGLELEGDKSNSYLVYDAFERANIFLPYKVDLDYFKHECPYAQVIEIPPYEGEVYEYSIKWLANDDKAREQVKQAVLRLHKLN